jgi:hypothetical protein
VVTSLQNKQSHRCEKYIALNLAFFEEYKGIEKELRISEGHQ